MSAFEKNSDIEIMQFYPIFALSKKELLIYKCNSNRLRLCNKYKVAIATSTGGFELFFTNDKSQTGNKAVSNPILILDRVRFFLYSHRRCLSVAAGEESLADFSGGANLNF